MTWPVFIVSERLIDRPRAFVRDRVNGSVDTKSRRLKLCPLALLSWLLPICIACLPVSLPTAPAPTSTPWPTASEVPIIDTAYPIPPGAFFVSVSGSDANSGTLTAPWRTIQHAVSSAPSGSTIVIRDGIYRESVSLVGKSLTLQPYPHERAWLKGSIVVSDWVRDGTVWRKDGWTYRLIPASDTRAIDPAHPLAGDPNMVFIDGQPLTEVASQSAVTAGTFFVDDANQKLYIGSDPTGKVVEAAVSVHALTLKHADGSIIRGLGFTQYAPHYDPDQKSMVRGDSDRLTFEKDTFVWSAAAGLSVSGSDDIVRGSIFENNGHLGLDGYNCIRLLIEGNRFAYNNVKGFRQDWEAGGVKVVSSRDMVWRDNVAEFNRGRGFWCDWTCDNVQIVRNIARSNSTFGIQYEKSARVIIASNLIVGNEEAGIQVIGSNEVSIYNNTLLRNGYAIDILDDRRRTGDPSASGITQGVVIKNNIFAYSSVLYVYDYSRAKAADQMVRTVDYNLYLYRLDNSGAANQLVRWSRGRSEEWFATVDEFRSEAGQERHGLGVEDGSGNSLFLDAANGDYRLKAGSVAIGRGEPLPMDIAAAIGAAPDVPVNLGILVWPAIARR